MEVASRPPLPWRSRAFDVVVAALLAGLSIMLLASMIRRPAPPLMVLVIALLVAHSGCLTWRRSAPRAVMAANVTSGFAVYALGFPLVVLGVASLVALYTVAARCPRRDSVVALAVTVFVMVIASTTTHPSSDVSTIAGNAVVLAVTWFMGDTQRARRAYVHQLEQRTAELEQARDELARRAVAEERLRIARELHDVVAHSMGMIAVQAGVGAHVIDSQPAEAKRSLQTIETASKTALRDIRQMLGLLRAGDETAATEPAPGVGDLPRLVDQIRSAGIDVELHVEGLPSLPPALQLTIFRVVQEALTNVVRHAAARRARVRIWVSEEHLRAEVVDDGTGGSGDGSGHGIAGMRERVGMHGGILEAGPLPEGGFRVALEVPLPGAET